jgi:hypothetical protein
MQQFEKVLGKGESRYLGEGMRGNQEGCVRSLIDFNTPGLSVMVSSQILRKLAERM